MMAAPTLAVLVLLLLAAALIVLAPLRRPARDTDAAERTRLEQERELLFAQLREEADPARRPALENRAARVLRALDGLPPAPPARFPARLVWSGLAACALILAVGTFSFLPRWQLSALGSGEARTVRTSLQLPSLRARAEQTQALPDYLAWGKAAFDAGQYPQAASAYASALKADTRQPEALRRLGIILLTRGDKDDGPKPTPQESAQAFLLIRTAAQLAPQHPESQLLLGFALSRFGQRQDALKALERYRTLDPQGRDADELISALRSSLNQASPGLQVYAANCASCHGSAGGGGVGPRLKLAGLTRETITAVIRNGKGSMPAYPNLSAAQVQAVTDVVLAWQKE